MQRTGGGVEGTWINQQESVLASGDHRCLGETDVVANGQANLSILRQINHCQLIAWREYLALLELDLAWDVDVE